VDFQVFVSLLLVFGDLTQRLLHLINNSANLRGREPGTVNKIFSDSRSYHIDAPYFSSTRSQLRRGTLNVLIFGEFAEGNLLLLVRHHT
jgi:hypothetical protein